LLAEVSKKYGNDVGRYRDVLADFSKTVEQITELTDKEIQAIKDLPKLSERDLQTEMIEIRETVDQFPDQLRRLKSTLPEELNKTNPDYDRAAAAARTGLGDLSRTLQQMIDGFSKVEKSLAPVISEMEKTVASRPATKPSAESNALASLKVFSTYIRESPARY